MSTPPYKHDICQRYFDSQEGLDAHIADLVNGPIVCRVNEGSLLTKGFNY